MIAQREMSSRSIYYILMRYVPAIERTATHTLYRGFFYAFVMLRVIYFVELVSSSIYQMFLFYYWWVRFLIRLHIRCIHVRSCQGNQSSLKPTTNNFINNKLVAILETNYTEYYVQFQNSSQSRFIRWFLFQFQLETPNYLNCLLI